MATSRFVLLAVAMLFTASAAPAPGYAQQPDPGLKTGTLKRGPDGKLYLDSSQPPPAPPVAEPAEPKEPPPAAQSAPVPAVKVSQVPTAPRTLAVCAKGCAYASLGDALAAAGPGDSVTVAAGLYAEAGVIHADHVRLLASAGARVKGVAAEGKAAIVVKGNDVEIDGLDCSDITVPDHNGACVRLEGRNLTLRRVHFHDAEQGVLSGPGTGVLTIEDSLFERLGAGGLAHAVYAGDMDALVIRRTAILTSRGEGHEVKSRAARTVIESSIIASLDGLDSRSLDIPNGGELLVRDSVLEKGLNSSNGDVIGFGLEGIKHPVNQIRLERVMVIVDRQGGVLINGAAATTLTEVKMIGGEKPRDSSLQWFANRAGAGLPAYPELPAVAGVARIDMAQRTTVKVCAQGCDFTSLSEALRQATSGSTVTVAAGVYHEGAVLRANHLTVKADPGVRLIGGTVESKAALVVKGDDTVLEGLDCSGIEVGDGNGACVRLEGRNLTLRRVSFHDSQEGLLANDDSGNILIEDSRFESLGNGGRAHAIYVGKAQSLTVRRTVILSTNGRGHGIKSRAARTLVESSVVAGLQGHDSRLIDAANGGDLLVRDSILEKGPASDNPEAIAFGLEGMSYPVNQLRLENNQFILDRPDSKLVRSMIHGSMSGGRVVGGDVGAAKQLLGKLTDFVVPGRIGDNLSIADDVHFFPDRAAAGLTAFPALPRL